MLETQQPFSVIGRHLHQYRHFICDTLYRRGSNSNPNRKITENEKKNKKNVNADY